MCRDKERMLRIFCWVCFDRRQFVMPQQSTLAVCRHCGNPEGAMPYLTPTEMILSGLKSRPGVETKQFLRAV